MREDTLARLAATIASRRAATAGTSYTESLLEKGTASCAKKLGEEATETVIAAVGESDDRLVSEAADLIYHLLVVLESRGLAFQSVLDELDRRSAQSGHAEKASRPKSGSET